MPEMQDMLPPPEIRQWMLEAPQNLREFLHKQLYEPANCVRWANTKLLLGNTDGYGPSPRPCNLPEKHKAAMRLYVDAFEKVIADEIAELRIRLSPEET